MHGIENHKCGIFHLCGEGEQNTVHSLTVQDLNALFFYDLRKAMHERKLGTGAGSAV